jgi:hypothetical protein
MILFLYKLQKYLSISYNTNVLKNKFQILTAPQEIQK